jgi:uncharacterized coiled-coil DUF342 family protein
MSSYKDSLEDAREELRELRFLRREIDQRIAQLEHTAQALATLCKETEEIPKGMTEAVRQILQATSNALSPTEVRDTLAKIGFDVEKYENPLAVVHTTLRRLAEQGEVTIVLRNESGGKSYRWTQNDPAALEALRRQGSAAVRFLDEFVKKRA